MKLDDKIILGIGFVIVAMLAVGFTVYLSDDNRMDSDDIMEMTMQGLGLGSSGGGDGGGSTEREQQQKTVTNANSTNRSS